MPSVSNSVPDNRRYHQKACGTAQKYFVVLPCPLILLILLALGTGMFQLCEIHPSGPFEYPRVCSESEHSRSSVQLPDGKIKRCGEADP